MKNMMKYKWLGFLLFLGIFFLAGLAHPVLASRFSLFALDIQELLKEGQTVGEARRAAISKGLRQAVEEAAYRIIPQRGLDTTYQKLKTTIFDHASQFVPQYKILEEKQFPGTFSLSLQVTVDMVLLRKALLKLKVSGKGEKKKVPVKSPVTLEIRNLMSGKTLMEVLRFFKQRPDLADDFELVSASHGVFIFSFLPLQPLKVITSQILYHAQISRGTFSVVKQEKDHLVLLYSLGKQS